MMSRILTSFILAVAISTTNAFAPTGLGSPSGNVGNHRMVPIDEVSDAVKTAAEAGNAISNMPTDMLLSQVTMEKLKEAGKSTVIVLLFGGGLIPAAIAANKALIGTLTGSRRGGEEGSDSEYITDSQATGPELPGSALLFASEKIPLVDVIAVIGRINDYGSVADWRNLPTTKIEAVNPDKPVMWLPRSLYKENIRKAKFNGWPVDPKTGEPVGGAELEAAEKRRISAKNAVIGDAALDAVFDSWAWGASVATPDKVEKTLKQYRNTAGQNTFNLQEFSGAAARGRAVTGVGALSFIVIQAVAYGSLFIAPALRVFANIDIGFGQMGACDPSGCMGLF